MWLLPFCNEPEFERGFFTLFQAPPNSDGFAECEQKFMKGVEAQTAHNASHRLTSRAIKQNFYFVGEALSCVSNYTK